MSRDQSDTFPPDRSAPPHGIVRRRSDPFPVDPNAPPRRIDVRGLTVRNLDFAYRDLQRDSEVSAQHVRTDLTYAVGQGAHLPGS